MPNCEECQPIAGGSKEHVVKTLRNWFSTYFRYFDNKDADYSESNPHIILGPEKFGKTQLIKYCLNTYYKEKNNCAVYQRMNDDALAIELLGKQFQVDYESDMQLSGKGTLERLIWALNKIIKNQSDRENIKPLIIVFNQSLVGSFHSICSTANEAKVFVLWKLEKPFDLYQTNKKDHSHFSAAKNTSNFSEEKEEEKEIDAFNEVLVSAFNKKDASQCIRCMFNNDESYFKKVIEVTGYHPFILKRVCEIIKSQKVEKDRIKDYINNEIFFNKQVWDTCVENSLEFIRCLNPNLYSELISMVVENKSSCEDEETIKELERWGTIVTDDPLILYPILFRDYIMKTAFDNGSAPIVPQRKQVFISYSHEDKVWLDKLNKTLKRVVQSPQITVWSDQQNKPGARWDEGIKRALSLAKVAVLLVTQEFLASKFIFENELSPLLKAAGKGDVTILWVAITHSAYEEAGLGVYQAANDPKHPLDSLSNTAVNKELVSICRKIKDAITS